jgi:hypothetical protein
MRKVYPQMSAGTAWTAGLVSEYLAEAADTLRRLPRPMLHGRLTCWPDVIRSAAELYHAEAHARNRPPAPAPDAISRMDQALVWLLPLDLEERRILWARACGIPWRRLEDADGRSHVTLRKIHRRGIERIMRRLPG